MPRLICLGNLALESAGSPVPVRRRKSLALLAYLVRQPDRTASRTALATLFWGDRDDERARQSLRQALTDLRSILGDTMSADGDQVRIRADQIRSDVEEFEAALSDGRLTTAANLWGGPFLAGLDDSLPDGGIEWLDRERAMLAQRHAWCLEQLVAERRAAGDRTGALAWATRWTREAPQSEAAARATVELALEAGRPAEALAARSEFLARQRETGAVASAEFEALGARIAAARPAGIGVRGLLSPDLVGRGEALGLLGRLLDQARSGPGQVALVEGDPGAGKSRFLAEFSRTTRGRHADVVVLEAQGFAAEKTRDFSTARDLLQPLVNAPGLAAAPPEALGLFAEIVPAVRERFRHLPPPTAGADPVDELTRIVGDVADDTPVVVLVDEAAAADEATARLLAAWIRRPPRRTLVVLATAHGDLERSRLAPAAADVGARLPRIELGPLSAEQLGELVQSMAPFDAAARTRLGAWLAAETGGLPATARRLIDRLADRGAIGPGSDGRWSIAGDLDTGAAGEDWARERLDRLGPGPRAVIESAAILLDGSDPSLLESLSGLPAADFQSALAEVLSRRLLTGTGAVGYRFPSEAARRAAERLMAPSQHRAAHARAAALLGAVRPGTPQVELAIARHWREAGGRPGRRGRRLVPALALLIGALALVTWRDRAARVPPGTQVLLADLANGTGDSTFDRSLETAAAIGLQESRRVTLFPRTRMVETLKRMGRPADTVLSEALAREIAQRENIGILVTLGVERVGDGYLLAARLVNPRTGADLRTARERADRRSAVVPALDRLIDRTRRLLGESAAEVGGGPGLASATTPSLDALKAYSDGSRAWGRGEWIRAADQWKRALALDSTFALANLAMARYGYVQANDRPMGDRYLARAVGALGRLTEPEQLMIRIEDAMQHGSPDVGLALAKELAERYPTRENWHNFGTGLMWARRCPEAIPALRRAMTIDSLYANSTINVATCFVLMGRPDSALAAYALAARADTGILYRDNLNHEWGVALIRAGRAAAAESAYRRMTTTGSSQNQARGWRSLGALELMRGRPRAAAAAFDSALASQTQGSLVTRFRNLLYLGGARLEAGDRGGALEAFDQADRLVPEQNLEAAFHLYLGYGYLQAGQTARAAAVAARLARTADTTRARDRAASRALDGLLAAARGARDGAIPPITVDPSDPIWAFAMRGTAALWAQRGAWDSAAAVSGRLARRWYDGSEAVFPAGQALLDLARYAEAAGDAGRARAALSDYLAARSDAESDLPGLVAARQALRRLQAAVAR